MTVDYEATFLGFLAGSGFESGPEKPPEILTVIVIFIFMNSTAGPVREVETLLSGQELLTSEQEH